MELCVSTKLSKVPEFWLLHNLRSHGLRRVSRFWYYLIWRSLSYMQQSNVICHTNALQQAPLEHMLSLETCYLTVQLLLCS